MLDDIVYSLQEAQEGKLSLYAQRAIDREYCTTSLTQEEQFAYALLKDTIKSIPQWSDEDELQADMEKAGGRVMFCHFFKEHNSMVQLTQDCNGKFDVSYVLDSEITPEERKIAAQDVQRLLAERMVCWDVPLMKSLIPEKMKYNYLEEAASHLMQVLNNPESITG